MKLFNTLLTAALAGRIERSIVDTIECPGRCWELSGTECTPEINKITIDCSVVGRVKATVDSCLFTPDNADYNQDYKVSTLKQGARQDGATGCFGEINRSSDVLEFDWTYAEAAVCGWVWADDAVANKLSFMAQLKASDNINKVTAQSIETTISKFPDNIDLQCNYENTVSITADFLGHMSDATQVATKDDDISLAAGFSVHLETGGNTPTANNFTIGQSLEAKFNYDSESAGFSGADVQDQPFGYFANKCYVENKDDTTQALYLVGSSDTDSTGKEDKCTMSSDPLDLHVSTNLAHPWWTRKDYTLTFDAFKFATSSKMTIVCNFEICLTTKCDTLAGQSSC